MSLRSSAYPSPVRQIYRPRQFRIRRLMAAAGVSPPQWHGGRNGRLLSRHRFTVQNCLKISSQSPNLRSDAHAARYIEWQEQRRHRLNLGGRGRTSSFPLSCLWRGRSKKYLLEPTYSTSEAGAVDQRSRAAMFEAAIAASEARSACRQYILAPLLRR